MPPFHGRSAKYGLGRQTAEGTALTVPKFELHMGGGGLMPDRTVQEYPWTGDSQEPLGHYVQKNAGRFEVQLPVLAQSAPAILYGAFGALATTGAADPYTHTATLADDLPWMTHFFKMPGGDFLTLVDAKFGSWALGGVPGDPLTFNANGIGKRLPASETTWGAATVVEPKEPFFNMIGATLKLDTSTTPATTQVRWIANHTITLNRNLADIQTDGIGNQYVVPQKRTLEIALNDAVPENLDIFNQSFYGTADPSGTDLVASVVYGSIDFLYSLSDGTVTTSRKLQITVPRVRFTVDPIQANASGDVSRYNIAGQASKPATGSMIQAVVLNAQSGTNY